MNALIFESTRRTCSVNPFSSELGIAENLPIVDGLISYDFQYSHQTFIFVIQNTLYITTMQHNIIPTFLTRAGGVILHDIPTIHYKDPMSIDHCIPF